MSFLNTPMIASAAAVLLATAFLLYTFFHKPPTAEELERRRRLQLNKGGKLGDGEVIDIEGASIIYSYHVAGVGYTASQDVSGLSERTGADLTLTIGPVAVKFDRRNPANSIVVCEDWTGLARRRRE